MVSDQYWLSSFGAIVSSCGPQEGTMNAFVLLIAARGRALAQTASGSQVNELGQTARLTTSSPRDSAIPGSIGIVIVAGTIIGFILEKTGGALVLAQAMLRLVGKSRSPLAMALAGYVVSIPVFCDSGFVILSPLNKALSQSSGISLGVLGTALSMGLYATHTMVPPDTWAHSRSRHPRRRPRACDPVWVDRIIARHHSRLDLRH